jgi:hypothetical protein
LGVNMARHEGHGQVGSAQTRSGSGGLFQESLARE